MASDLYHFIEKHVDEAWKQLDSAQLTPWLFLKAGPALELRDFAGRSIRYEGVAFEGSPREVFWGGYVEPFLAASVDETLAFTVALARERNQDAKPCLRRQEAC